jgi:hypothetical protein
MTGSKSNAADYVSCPKKQRIASIYNAHHFEHDAVLYGNFGAPASIFSAAGQ